MVTVVLEYEIVILGVMDLVEVLLFIIDHDLVRIVLNYSLLHLRVLLNLLPLLGLLLLLL